MLRKVYNNRKNKCKREKKQPYFHFFAECIWYFLLSKEGNTKYLRKFITKRCVNDTLKSNIFFQNEITFLKAITCQNTVRKINNMAIRKYPANQYEQVVVVPPPPPVTYRTVYVESDAERRRRRRSNFGNAMLCCLYGTLASLSCCLCFDVLHFFHHHIIILTQFLLDIW